jgi:hypothetical protein
VHGPRSAARRHLPTNHLACDELFYFGKGSVTNDLYLSPAVESRAELPPRQSTEAVAIPGFDLAGTVSAGTRFAGEARFGGTEVHAVAPPCTDILPNAGNEPERTATCDALRVVVLFIAVRGAPWICCGNPTRTGRDACS